MPDMFCFQCQQTAGNKGCVVTGVCGKQLQIHTGPQQPTDWNWVAALQQTVSCRQERVIKIACIQHQLLDMKD